MQWCLSQCGKYKIESLTTSTFPAALEVIRNAFCQDEAIAIGAEVNKNPIAIEELLELSAYSALDGVSLVAIESKSGEVVSVAFNKIQVASTDSETFFDVFSAERCTHASSRSLISFMANVDARCNLFQKYNVDCSFEIMFLATLKEHRGKGLGKLLCEVSIEQAKKVRDGCIININPQDLGPKYSHIPPNGELRTYPKLCQAIFTSNISQKIGHALKFTVDLRISYKEFVHNGKTFADRLGPQSQYCDLASKIL